MDRQEGRRGRMKVQKREKETGKERDQTDEYMKRVKGKKEEIDI